MAFVMHTTAWPPGAVIPVKYTCDGPDVSPPLSWSGPPKGTKSFTLIADDPDAPVGTWVHWVLYGMAATLSGLPEGVPKQERVAGVGIQGVNDFGKVGYGGPCPPRGPAHRYFFKLYALDSDLRTGPRRTKQALLKAMDGHVLGHAELIGKYARR